MEPSSRLRDAREVDTSLIDGLILLLARLLIGAFGTLIGAGGGCLVVPILLLGYH
jgi:uncharacterized membrane protein YfcA